MATCRRQYLQVSRRRRRRISAMGPVSWGHWALALSAGALGDKALATAHVHGTGLRGFTRRDGHRDARFSVRGMMVGRSHQRRAAIDSW